MAEFSIENLTSVEITTSKIENVEWSEEVGEEEDFEAGFQYLESGAQEYSEVGEEEYFESGPEYFEAGPEYFKAGPEYFEDASIEYFEFGSGKDVDAEEYFEVAEDYLGTEEEAGEAETLRIEELIKDGCHPHHPRHQNNINTHHHHRHTIKSTILGGLLRRQYRDEIKAVHTMKELTKRVGVEHKSNQTKRVNARDLEDEMAENMMVNPCGCELQDKKIKQKLIGDKEDDAMGQENSLLKSLREHPPSIVSQSTYVKHLVELVSNELARAGCPPPSFTQKRKGVDPLKQSKKGDGHGHQHKMNDPALDDTVIREPEDRMLARLMIYSRAFSAVILHFSSLRPILLDIKRNYDSVLALRDRQMTELRFIKRSIAYKELSMDEYMADLRVEGYGEKSEMEKKTYVLLRHIDKQDEVIKTMTEILGKLEASLEEEQELRKQTDDQKRSLIQEVNELRRKVQMPVRTDAVEEEVTATDEMNGDEEALNTDDPVVLRTALQACRKNLSDAQSRLTIVEADYADVIPRADFDSLKEVMSELESRHSTLLNSYNALTAQERSTKEQIDKLMEELYGHEEEEEEQEEEEQEDEEDEENENDENNSVKMELS